MGKHYGGFGYASEELFLAALAKDASDENQWQLENLGRLHTLVLNDRPLDIPNQTRAGVDHSAVNLN